MTQPPAKPSPRYPWIAVVTRTAVGVGALLLALVIFAVLSVTAPQTNPSDENVSLNTVQVIRLTPVEVARQWRGLGTIQPVESVNIPARVAATVTGIAEGVDTGTRVQRGDPLVVLDHEDFTQQVEIATQNILDLDARVIQLDNQEKRLTERQKLEEELLDITKAELARVERLYKRDAATQQDLDRARRTALDAERALTTTLEQIDAIPPQRTQIAAQKASQQASLRLAELGVERCKIVSPIDGIVESLDVEVGENVPLGQRVARVVGISRVEVPLNVPASARADLVTGDPVTLRLAGGRTLVCDGFISRILPANDATTGTAAFYAEIPQPDAEARFGTPDGADLLLPGAFVTGIVTGQGRESRWVVPRRSIRAGRLLLVRDGVVESCEVRSDYTLEDRFPQFGVGDDQWVVLGAGDSPLRAGDLLVVTPTPTLSDGLPVAPVVAGRAPQDGAPPAPLRHADRGGDQAEDVTP